MKAKPDFDYDELIDYEKEHQTDMFKVYGDIPSNIEDGVYFIRNLHV